MIKYTIVGGNSSEELAKKIAKRLKAEFIKTGLKVFPDGERKITLSSKPKKNTVIIIVQSTFPPVDSNLIELLSLIHKVKESGTKVMAVIPYMGYARQDQEFLPGEIVTMKVIAKLLKSSGVTKVLVVDIHSKIALKHFKSSGKNISAIPDLVKTFEEIKF